MNNQFKEITDRLVNMTIHFAELQKEGKMTIELIQEMKAFMRSHFDELNLSPLMQNLRAVGREREFNAYMALLNKHLGMSKDLIPFELKLQDYALADKIMSVIQNNKNKAI